MSKHSRKSEKPFKQKHSERTSELRHSYSQKEDRLKIVDRLEYFTQDSSDNKLCSQSSSFSRMKEDRLEEFDWDRYKSALNKIFFSDKDIIKKGTPEYFDFWRFLKKYLSVQKKAKKAVTYSNSEDRYEETWLNIPKDYNKEHKISFRCSEENIDEMMMRGLLFKDDNDEYQSLKEKLVEFRYILLLYIDFLQKQKFQKLRKLRQAQAHLPITSHKEQILSAVSSSQTVIIAGDTGCGKSTQVPQYLLEAGYNKIACTQPRRIACISLCKRVAFETLNEYGRDIGYQIRFEKDKTQHTRILFLTEGLLLRQVSSDPMLSSYDVIILDEVHERHLSCDFLLGIVKCLIHQRSDLKVILMSATINIQLFANYFRNSPVIQVPGRLFPIEVHYRPITMEDKLSKRSRLNPSPYIQVMQLIDSKYKPSERGDLLIFLSGITEISIVAEAAQMYADQTKQWIILTLHSTLSLEDQEKVFGVSPEGIRKCIISTNIAETSVTIDGIRFVADSGKVKEMSYDPDCRMQRLKEFWISCASAEQRKGRAGRTGPGVCFRLYSEKEYKTMSAYSTPEIQRVPLDCLLLQMMTIGLPNTRKFPFLESPPTSSIEVSLQNLKNEGALTENEKLTSIGHMLSRLPVDVTIGKILILGSAFHIIDPVMSLAAVVSVQSPFTSRSLKDANVMAAQKSLHSDHGDPFTLLNSYQKWLEIKADRHCNSRKWCKRHGIEEQRFYEVTKLRQQFKELLQDAHLIESHDRYSTSTERAQRYGELRHLKNMRRSFHQAPKCRKMLKLDTDYVIKNEDDEDCEIDIRDVEFQISNDHTQIQHLSEASQAYSHSDLRLLKLILCSGFYPQLSLPDEHNTHRSDSEQFFHTKKKSFVALHPNGVFAIQPDLLHLHELDIEQFPGFHTRTPLSRKHQLLAFMSLLETTKPYLMNCVRVPSSHTILLLSCSLDTNHDFTRIVADEWLEVRFPQPEESQQFVILAMSIRDTWQNLLHHKLKESLSPDAEHREDSEIKKMRKVLQRLIKEFLHIEILHSVRRLLSADLKSLYIGPSEGNLATSKVLKDMVEESKPHAIKGGLIIRSYLTYNCLSDANLSHLQYTQNDWKCPYCDQEMTVTLLDQIRHQEKCQKQLSEKCVSEEEASIKTGSLKKHYFCEICKRDLCFTPVEILKHKQSCRNLLHCSSTHNES